MKIQVEREDLASLIYLSRLSDDDMSWDRTVRLLSLINKMMKLIEEYDRQLEIKEIGEKYIQQELF